MYYNLVIPISLQPLDNLISKFHSILYEVSFLMKFHLQLYLYIFEYVHVVYDSINPSLGLLRVLFAIMGLIIGEDSPGKKFGTDFRTQPMSPFTPPLG